MPRLAWRCRFIWLIWAVFPAVHGRLRMQIYTSCRLERTRITFQIRPRARTETNGGAAENSRLPSKPRSPLLRRRTGEGLPRFDINRVPAQLSRAVYSPGAFGHQGVLRACQ